MLPLTNKERVKFENAKLVIYVKKNLKKIKLKLEIMIILQEI